MTQNETETICHVEVPKRTKKAESPAPIPRGKLVTKSEGLWPWQSAKFTNYAKYRIYIQSPHWGLIRDRALALAGRACEHCQSRNRLTVHHLNYRTLFNEGAEDLMCLCWTCHKKVESNAADRPSALAFLSVARPLPEPLEPLPPRSTLERVFTRSIAKAEVDGFHCRYA